MSEETQGIRPHERLAVFLGDWRAEGTSYGGEEQSAADPRGGATQWRSIHSARWHSGNYFIVQDERANGPFDTLSFMGWDPEAKLYFVRSIENHGFARNYTMTVVDRDWTLRGEHERATFTFSPSGGTQYVKWEWKPAAEWLPLCERTAHRIA